MCAATIGTEHTTQAQARRPTHPGDAGLHVLTALAEHVGQAPHGLHPDILLVGGHEGEHLHRGQGQVALRHGLASGTHVLALEQPRPADVQAHGLGALPRPKDRDVQVAVGTVHAGQA